MGRGRRPKPIIGRLHALRWVSLRSTYPTSHNRDVCCAPILARGHVTGEAGRLRVARHSIAPAPDRYANAVSRSPSPAVWGKGPSNCARAMVSFPPLRSGGVGWGHESHCFPGIRCAPSGLQIQMVCVGWVERSETHRSRSAQRWVSAYGLYPSYGLAEFSTRRGINVNFAICFKYTSRAPIPSFPRCAGAGTF